MNIIIITEKDAANVSMGRISNEFACRGHNVRVFYPFFVESLKSDFDKNIDMWPMDKLDDDALKWCDLVFLSSIAVDHVNEALLTVEKPIFVHSYMVNGQVDWGGDCRFVASLETASMDYGNYFTHIDFAIGEPKYDTFKCQRENKKTNTFLFIDSGHFPFGKKGKIDLARCILSICKTYPDYMLVIKPRFLPKDTVITHRNTQTLYDALLEESNGVLPANLNYLDEHYDLMTLIERCDVVICLYTSAYVGACVANKGLVILDGFESDDVYDVRRRNFEKIKRNMIYTNALIDYREVNSVLPSGVNISDEAKRKLVSESDNVSNKIVEVVEYLFHCFYSKKKFPKINDYVYCEYKKNVEVDENLDWQKVIELRIRNYLMRQSLIHFSFRLSTIIDVSEIIQYVNSIDFKNIDIKKEIKNLLELRSECLAKNKDLLIEDDIDAGIVLNALYMLDRTDEILNFSRKDIGAFYLFAGFVYMDIGQEENARINLEKYFEITKDNPYIKEISDMSGNRFRAYDSLINIYIDSDKMDEAIEYLNQMEEYYKSFYRVGSLADEKVDVRQKNTAEMICEYKKKLQILKV